MNENTYYSELFANIITLLQPNALFVNSPKPLPLLYDILILEPAKNYFCFLIRLEMVDWGRYMKQSHKEKNFCLHS